MNKEVIVVPKEVKFLSDWKNFINYLPNRPCILDKRVTGCGFTEWAIRCDIPIVLCSPRKILLENKESQHPSEVLYFRNNTEKVLNFDKNLLKDEVEKYQSIAELILSEKKRKIQAEQEEAIKFREIIHLKTQLRDYCCTNTTTPKKILVTYDSFRHVKEVLSELGIFDKFLVIIDEFQSIFTDSRFKPDTELEFLTQLQGFTNVIFVSATPMIEEYLDRLEEFRNLPYYELDWKTENPLRIIEPDIEAHKLFNYSVQGKIAEIVEDYRNNNGERYITSDGRVIQSKEAVFYVNSVKNICDTITKAKLTPEECNILCANTVQNYEKIKKALKLKKAEAEEKLKIGVVPKRGEQHKMFTFCTRTVYLGADFYSTNAKTYIFSDANIDCLAVDITLDLPQIMGRQRLSENPWKNKASLYFKLSGKDVPESEFDNLVKTKTENTNVNLVIYDDLSSDSSKSEVQVQNLMFIAEKGNYKMNYVSVNRHAGKRPIPVFNNLVMLAERRAFDIQQIDYKDRCSVYNALEKVSKVLELDKVTTELIDRFDAETTFIEKMRVLVDNLPNLDSNQRDYVLKQIPVKFQTYINTISFDRIKALGYRMDLLENELNLKVYLKSNFDTEILSKFSENGKYTTKYIKSTLNEIYTRLGIKKLAKASDLADYFNITPCKIKNEEGKWEHGFELTSLNSH